MAVKFVIGRAGSGKTRRCVDAIAAALRADPLGKPIYWIVPKQATFSAERMLLAEVGAFCRARVVSFESLGREIFAYAGGNAIPEVTPLGRQMVIGHLLRQLKPQLRFFASSARQPGLAAELDAAFAEFERSGKTPTELNTLIDELEIAKPVDVDPMSLVDKLRDIRLVYDAYTKYLGQDRLDQHQRLQQVLGCLDGCPPLRGATAYVDGFTEFSSHERKLLAGLGKVCAHVEVLLLLDPASDVVRDPHHLPNEGGLFHQTERTYRSLWFAMQEEGVAVAEPVKLPRPGRFDASGLRRIEQSFGKSLQPPADDADDVAFIVAPNRAAEVNAVARAIRKLWREGMRLRDIAVLVRDVEPYHALIDASFREHGVAYFVDRRRSAAHHPLLQFVRSFFQIARYDWPNEPVIALMKTGLATLTPDEADEVENYVDRHHIRGVAWDAPEPWAYRRKLTRDGEDDVAAVEEHPETVDDFRRRVVDKLRPSVSLLRLNRSLTVRDVATELFAALDRFKVRETLAAWRDAAATEDPEQAAEHEQVWAEFVELCEQMVDLLGGERVELQDFVDVLESGLERFDLAITPPTVDQVLVGSVDRTRCPPGLRACFVLGLNEGEFPRVAREPSVLTDPERRELRKRHVELDADRRGQIQDEELLGYIAVSRASERLIVSRTLANDDDRPVEPSRFWERLRGTFPEAPVVEIPREIRDDLRFAETPREVVVGLMQWARDSASKDSGPPEYAGGTVWPSLYQWLAAYPRNGDAIDQTRALAWPALGYVNDAAITPATASKLYGEPLQVTARQLETFATCPFKHFARFGLALSATKARGVSAMDLSQVYHQVLDIVMKEVLESSVDWLRLGEVVTPGMIREYAEAVGQTLRGELMLSTARNAYLLKRIERTLEEVVATQGEMMCRGQFRPGFTGVGFGENGPLPALRVPTPGGRDAILHGNIDRVDLLPGGTHAAVFDYRLSSAPLSMSAAYHGLSLQLLTHLLVLQSSGEELAGKPITPVAAFYLPLLRRLNDVDHPDEAADPASATYRLRVKPRGVFDEHYLPALDAAVEPGKRSDVVNAMVKQDGTIGHRNTSDAAGAEEFNALLAFVRRRIGELADEIVRGWVDVTPYRISRETPCPRCEFRSVCRFEPAINRYRNLEPMARADVFARVTEGDDGGH